MGIVMVDISVSMDGFIAGRNLSEAQPLGQDGELLHTWFFEPVNEHDKKVMDDVAASTGAVIMGRTMYDLGINTGWGGVNPFSAPVWVVTSKAAPENLVEGFTFIKDDIYHALAQAEATAGEKNIWIVGGANIIQQYLKANLVDELRLHIIPILLGEGTRLFEASDAGYTKLEQVEVSQSPVLIHSRYRFVK